MLALLLGEYVVMDRFNAAKNCSGGRAVPLDRAKNGRPIERGEQIIPQRHGPVPKFQDGIS
jgi:hypothetical protein